MISKIIFCALLAVTVRAWNDAELECMTELHLNHEDFDQYDGFKLVPEDNEDFNKFTECYYTKKNWYAADGKVDAKAIEEIVDRSMGDDSVSKLIKDKLHEIIEDCTARDFEGSRGAVAVKVQNCAYKFAKENIIDKF